MVEVPEPQKNRNVGLQRPSWVSVQVNPVTSQPISQRQIPGGLLSPDYRVRKATANTTTDPGNLISTLLMDPVSEVRRTAATRLADLYSASDYSPGFAIRLTICCAALANSKDNSHQQIARLLTHEMVSRTVTAQTPAGAFGTLVTAIFFADVVTSEQRNAARIQVKADTFLENVLQAIAKKSVTLDGEIPNNQEIEIVAREVDYIKRRNLDLDSACTVIACLSKNERVVEHGAKRLAAMSRSHDRSSFDLRMLGFLATPVSTANSTVIFGRFQFDEGDIANLAPWLVLRYGSRPEAASPQDEMARSAELGGAEWAKISSPFLLKLEQYCATGSPTALIGAARLLRVFGHPNSAPEIDKACIDVALAQLGALKNLRAAARFSDAILAQEINAQIRFISRNYPTDYKAKAENVATISGLATLGIFDPRNLIVLARRVGDISTATDVVASLIRHVEIAAMDENLSVRARSLRTQSSLADIVDGLTGIIRSWGPNFRFSVELVKIFGALCEVVSTTSNHEEYGVIKDKVIGLLIYISNTIFAPHRRDLNLHAVNNLASRLIAPDVATNAPLCKLLFDLLNSPVAPALLLEPVEQKMRFAAIDSHRLLKLFRKLSTQLSAPRNTALQNDFDWREILIDTLTEVSQFILSEHWGVEDTSLTKEDLTIAIAACKFVVENPSESGATKLKANRLLTILKGN